jgi:hypothetical protein
MSLCSVSWRWFQTLENVNMIVFSKHSITLFKGSYELFILNAILRDAITFLKDPIRDVFYGVQETYFKGFFTCFGGSFNIL